MLLVKPSEIDLADEAGIGCLCNGLFWVTELLLDHGDTRFDHRGDGILGAFPLLQSIKNTV